jgi:hypothetical protein
MKQQQRGRRIRSIDDPSVFTKPSNAKRKRERRGSRPRWLKRLQAQKRRRDLGRV